MSKLQETQDIAQNLMAKYLTDEWTFGFDNAKNRFGQCDQTRKRITISKGYASVNDEPEIRDTILHEIAHALTPDDKEHGKDWQSMCVVIGATPERYNYTGIAPKHKWVGHCPTEGCERRIYRHRRDYKIACRVCCYRYANSEFDEKYKFEWVIDE